jgi:hypothetical protein
MATSHRGCPRPYVIYGGQSGQWDRFSSELFGFFPVHIIPPWLSVLIYHLGDEQKARWWLQFRDIVSLYRHKQQQQIVG